MQNVFEQKTYRPVSYSITSEAMARIKEQGIFFKETENIMGKEFPDAEHFYSVLSKSKNLKPKERDFILKSAEIYNIDITNKNLETISSDLLWITKKKKTDLEKLEGFYDLL
jgi:hypothetical protein